MSEVQGDAIQVGNMFVSLDETQTRVMFDPDPDAGEGHGVAKPKLERAEVGLLINFLQRVHGVMR